MKLTAKQFNIISKYFPIQRGNVKISNENLLHALLYITENGCKWRALPKEYGNWHTLYVRMSRLSKKGILLNIFEALKAENIIDINTETFFIDSTTVKVHPDAMSGFKKRKAIDR